MSSIVYIIKGFLAGFLGIFIGLFLFFAIGQLLFKNFYKPYVVLSGSMEPAVKTGSVVVVKPADSYFIGDIITFAPNGNKKDLVTHRIANVEASDGEVVYQTKGDANEDPDTWNTKREFIMGKSQFSMPYAGYVVDFAKKPQGFILFVIIPATIIVYEELKSMKNEIFKKKNKKIHQDSIVIHSSPNKNSKGSKTPRWAVIAPIFGVVFVISFAVTKSYFLDKESNASNVLGAGTWISSPSPSPTPSTQALTLVINEVLPDSSCVQGQTEAQWIEVYNGYPNTVNLKNFKITDGSNTIDLVTSNTDVPSGAFALLAHNNAIWNQCYDDNNAITANLGGQLNIDTGTLQLLDLASAVIDSVKWGGANVHQPAQDESIERDPDGRDTVTGTNFFDADFVLRIIPQPGL